MRDVYQSKIGNEIVIIDRKTRVMTVFGKVHEAKLDKDDVDHQAANLETLEYTRMRGCK